MHRLCWDRPTPCENTVLGQLPKVSSSCKEDTALIKDDMSDFWPQTLKNIYF